MQAFNKARQDFPGWVSGGVGVGWVVGGWLDGWLWWFDGWWVGDGWLGAVWVGGWLRKAETSGAAELDNIWDILFS